MAPPENRKKRVFDIGHRLIEKIFIKYFGKVGSTCGSIGCGVGGQIGSGLGSKGHILNGLHSYPHGQFLSR